MVLSLKDCATCRSMDLMISCLGLHWTNDFLGAMIQVSVASTILHLMLLFHSSIYRPCLLNLFLLIDWYRQLSDYKSPLKAKQLFCFTSVRRISNVLTSSFLLDYGRVDWHWNLMVFSWELFLVETHWSICLA